MILQFICDKILTLRENTPGNIQIQDMKIDVESFKEVDKPIYIIEEARLRHNLELIRNVARMADVEIILAFKAFALWKTFPIFREYIHATTASSLNEALLAYREFGSGHTLIRRLIRIMTSQK